MWNTVYPSVCIKSTQWCHSSHYLCTPVWIHVNVVKGFSIGVTIHACASIYFSIIVSRVLYSTSPVYSEAMGSTGSKNRCSLCPRQLSTAIVHRATQKGVSEERGDCHTPTRQRGRKVNSREGASWVKYLHQESLELAPSFHPPNVLTHLCHDDVPNKAECPSSTLNCKNFHWTITICNTTWPNRITPPSLHAQQTFTHWKLSVACTIKAASSGLGPEMAVLLV